MTTEGKVHVSRVVETADGLFREVASIEDNSLAVQKVIEFRNHTQARSMSARETVHDLSHRIRSLQQTYQLETTFSGDNGNAGIMFDIRSPPGNHTIRVISLDLHVNLLDPACSVLIYGRRGSHLGFQTSPGNWTLLVNGTLNCLGYSLRTHVPEAAFLETPELVGGSTYAFYVSLPTPNVRYSNGNQLGAPFTSNEHIELMQGTGISGLFSGNLIQPRVFNGAITYEALGFVSSGINVSNQLDTCDDELSTSYEDNLGSYGNMFNVRTYNNSIVVTGIDFYTDILEPVTYELYTRPGSYVGGLGDISEWILLKRGTTNGLGSGRGTPIRNFATVAIHGNTTQGFYVTLTTPDIRYQDISKVRPNALQGDVYRSNNDMEVQIGVGIGTFPLSSSNFGPRVWSGTFHYTAERPCPTEAPSLPPSSSPTTSPPTLAPTIPAHDFGDCEDSSRMVTTWGGGTGAFGSFFTVQSHSEPVSIDTLEFHVDLSSYVEVIVFSKVGDYRGFEEEPTAWRRVAQTQVLGGGTGRGTLIPENDFETVHMLPSETRAFYVTLNTADLRYSRTDVSVGEAFISGELLSINAGAGLADPIFGSSIYEPRMFNGAVHFTHTCAPTLLTDVVYTFHIEHLRSLSETEMLEMVSRNVRETVVEILQFEAVPQEYRLDHELLAVGSSSEVVIIPGSDEICAPTSIDWICTSVDATVSFSHTDTLSAGNVIYTMLQYSQMITQSLNLVELRARYAGDIPADSDLRITFKGGFEREFTEEEVEYFQDVTYEYLNDHLTKLGANALGVELTGQTLKAESASRRLQRTSSSSEIEVTVTVTGEFRPPPFIDFENVVEDAIDSDKGSDYQEMLRNGGRSRPEGLGEGNSFEKVEDVGAEAQSKATPAPLNTVESDTNSSFGMIVGIMFACAILAILGLFVRRRWKARQGAAAIIDLRGSFHASRVGPFGFLGKKSSHALFNQEEIIDAEVSYMYDEEGQDAFQDEYSRDGLESLDDYSKAAESFGNTTASGNDFESQTYKSLGSVQSYRSSFTAQASLRSVMTESTAKQTNLTSSRRLAQQEEVIVDGSSHFDDEHVDTSDNRQRSFALTTQSSQRSILTDSTPKRTNLASHRQLVSNRQLVIEEEEQAVEGESPYEGEEPHEGKEPHEGEEPYQDQEPFGEDEYNDERPFNDNVEEMEEEHVEETPFQDEYDDDQGTEQDQELSAREISFVYDDGYEDFGERDVPKHEASMGQLQGSGEEDTADVTGPPVASPHPHRVSPGMPVPPHQGSSRPPSLPRHFSSPNMAPISPMMPAAAGDEGGFRRPSPVGFTPGSAFTPLPSNATRVPPAAPVLVRSPSYITALGRSPPPPTSMAAFSHTSAFSQPSRRSLNHPYN